MEGSSGGARVRCAGIALLVASLLVCTQSSCGGGQTRGHPLDSSWSDEDGSELSAFQHGWTARSAPRIPGVAIGVTDAQTVVGRGLEGGRTWWFEHPLESRPQIAGSLVVGLGGGTLFALDALSGELLWERKALGTLRGAADDGETTLVSIASLSGKHSVVLAVARDGKVTRQLYLEATVGSPAVFDAYAFLPWNRETVVVFDLVEGTEAARVVASYPISNARVVDGELYFGEDELVRFDERIVEARRDGGTRVKLPARSIPGEPHWLLPGSLSLPPEATREDTIRYFAQPLSDASGSRIDRYALGYRQLVLGLQAPSAAIRWVHVGEHDHLGGDAGRDHVTMCDTAGDVTTLSLLDGSVLERTSLGASLLACSVQSPGAPSAATTTPPPLAEQLRRALSVPAPRLHPIQLELLEELARLDGEPASAALIALASDAADGQPEPAPAIVRRARKLLARRRTGLAALVAALEQPRGSPLERPRIPLTEIATAVRDRQVAAAAPALARLLGWPSLSPRQTATVAGALASLAGPDELRALTLFFARMRCDAAHPALERAVIQVARALLRLGNGSLVERVARGSCDQAQMKASLLAEVAAFTGRQSGQDHAGHALP